MSYYRRHTRTRGMLLADGTNILVFGPFEAKDDLKALPVRRWDAVRRCWVVPAPLHRAARQILERWCTAVDDRTEDVSSWVVDLFAVIPDEHLDRIYRALSVAVHPDHGGSTRLMSEVNRVHDARLAVRKS